MNSSQRLNQLCAAVENASGNLIRTAKQFADSDYAYHNELHRDARRYADAIRALRNEHRNAKRRSTK